MAFYIKVIDKINCPRCNAIAELRIDQIPPKNNWVFVYIVCSTCRLNRYRNTISRKDVVLQQKMKRIAKSKISANKKRRLFDNVKKIK